MPIQFLVVRYDRRRKVYIDGKRSGFTNRKLRVEEGSHSVDLGSDLNYKPNKRRPNVTGTSVGTPMEISFERIS